MNNQQMLAIVLRNQAFDLAKLHAVYEFMEMNLRRYSSLQEDNLATELEQSKAFFKTVLAEQEQLKQELLRSLAAKWLQMGEDALADQEFQTKITALSYTATYINWTKQQMLIMLHMLHHD